MDEFERQIRRHRVELDAVEDIGTPELWSGIEERMSGRNTGRRLRRKRRWLAAATVLLVFSLGLGYLSWPGEENIPMTLSDLSPELAEKETAFQQVISAKEDALNIKALDRETFAPYLEELSIIDSLQANYLNELPEYGTNERLLNAIIRYYELKIQILEQLENDLAKQQYYDIPNQQLEI